MPTFEPIPSATLVGAVVACAEPELTDGGAIGLLLRWKTPRGADVVDVLAYAKPFTKAHGELVALRPGDVVKLIGTGLVGPVFENMPLQMPLEVTSAKITRRANTGETA